MSVYLSGFINHLFYAWFLHFTVFSVTPIRVLFNRRKNWGRRNFRMLSFYNRITQKDIIFTNLKLPSWRSLMRLLRIPGECCNRKPQTEPLYEKHRLWLEQNCPNHNRCLKTSLNRDRLSALAWKINAIVIQLTRPLYTYFLSVKQKAQQESSTRNVVLFMEPGTKKDANFFAGTFCTKKKRVRSVFGSGRLSVSGNWKMQHIIYKYD